MQQHTISSFIINAIRPFKPYIAMHLFVVIFAAVETSLWPYLTKVFIDQISTTPRQEIFPNILPITSALIILTMLPAFVWRICDYAWTKMTPRLKKKIAVETMDYLMQHSFTFFQNNFAGSLANKVRDLTTCAQQILEKLIYNFLNVILSLAIALFALFTIHKLFAIAMLVWATIFILIAIRGAKITGGMSIGIADQQTKITGTLVDILSNISNVKFFSRRGYENNKISGLQDEYTKLSEKRNFFLLKFYLVHGITFCAYYIFCIITLIKLYAGNLVTLGDFIMLFTINNWIIHIMWMAANELRNFLEDVGTMNQALTILNEPLKIKDVDGASDLITNRKNGGEIVFENVRFTYEGKSSPLFSDKNLVIKSGEKVGLVGHSGSGKTTFVNLILRLFDVDSGRILIDGQDISRVTQNSLRAMIGMIPQDPSLFHRTLVENISY